MSHDERARLNDSTGRPLRRKTFLGVMVSASVAAVAATLAQVNITAAAVRASSDTGNERSAQDEREIRRLTDLLFIYTDQKAWAAARGLFVDGPIEVDMSSLVGGSAVQMTADQLFGGFSVGLHSNKISHHMATNYLVTLNGDQAELWAHGLAWNRLLGADPGNELWETWGNYRLTFRRTGAGWRMDGFRYYAAFNRGNDAVRTHTQ